MKRKHLLLAVALAASSPALGAAPDTEAVEFYNVARNHYFVTAVASEAGAIEAGLAGPGWVRTGRSFQAWIDPANAPPDAHPVCRFFAESINSHFYTADAAECSFLRGNPTGWKYEGTAFYIQKPASGGRCPEGTVEILRHYNNGFTNGQGSNHRFVDDAELSAFMADGEWLVEGTAFCAAAKATGTSANLAPTRTSFESLAGTWSGEAKWEIETGGQETQVRAPLELTLAADGTVTGTGAGCTFAGEVTLGDGFRAFFRGEVAATGCTDANFNGDYPRLRLQLLRTGILMVQMKRGDDDTLEAKVQAKLTLDGATPPAGRPPRSFEGAWVGTVRWEAEGQGLRIQANRPLELQVTADGAVSGTGFGCTFAGTLTGDIMAAGCEQSLFDGAYRLRLRGDSHGRLKVELERESGGVEAEIEGVLIAETP